MEKVKMLMGSIQRQDIVGKIFLIQLSWLQLLSGRKKPLLEINTPIGYLPKCWLQNMQCLLAIEGIGITIDGVWTPKEQRENNTIIMDYVWKHLPEWKWESINRCRIYLKAVSFTDIVTFDGKWVSREIYQVKQPQRKSRLMYPKQKRPTTSDIRYRQHFI